MKKSMRSVRSEKIEFRPWSKLRARLFRDPKVKKAYDDLEFEFTLIRAILDARTKKGMTQKKLAEKLGTKQSAIARFEAGNANPTLSFLKKLSRALDLKLTVHE